MPFDNNPAERTIRTPKLRIKFSGSMRTMTGAEHFAAIRTATATRHGINMLDALTRAATPRFPHPPDPPRALAVFQGPAHLSSHKQTTATESSQKTKDLGTFPHPHATR
ncbi:hypothetical protein [Micromonospora sp. LOL_023]|uniref:hypothetical protein n=1 Tax=Micromonospora sp. LOL_023 TaxID=3345418 RepID=UPI003A85593A